MQCINRVELLGTVVSFRTNFIADKTVSTIHILTERGYTNKEGTPCLEAQRHQVVVWDNNGNLRLQELKVNDIVHVTGILTYRKYETADNQERYVSEIKATSFQICKPEENAVLPEMTM